MLNNIPQEIKEIKIGTTPIMSIIWYLLIGASIGGLITKQIDTNNTVDSNKKYTIEQISNVKELINQEVGGLRADWERENKEVHRRLNKIEDKIFTGHVYK